MREKCKWVRRTPTYSDDNRSVREADAHTDSIMIGDTASTNSTACYMYRTRLDPMPLLHVMLVWGAHCKRAAEWGSMLD